jgi:Arc/MetJ family transcription regulator
MINFEYLNGSDDSAMMKEIIIKIDEDELAKLKQWFITSTEQEAVESAVSQVLKFHAYQELLRLEGKINWEGDLDALRR